MLRALGVMGEDRESLGRAGEVLSAASRDAGAVNANVASAALAIVAANGSMEDFADFERRFREAGTPQEANRYRRAMTAVPEPEAAAAVLDMMIDGTIKRQDANSTLALLLGHRDNGARTWAAVRDRWGEVAAALNRSTIRRTLDFIYFRSEPDVAADIRAWLDANPLGASDRHVAQQLERLDVRVGLRRRVEAELGGSLAAHR